MLTPSTIARSLLINVVVFIVIFFQLIRQNYMTGIHFDGPKWIICMYLTHADILLEQVTKFEKERNT